MGLELAELPLNSRVDRNTRTVRTKARGVLEVDDFMAHAHALVKEKVFAYSQLIDAREADLKISAGDVRRLVDRIKTLRKIHGTARTAFVTRYPAAFGMMRMYATLSEEYDPGFAVFREIGDAEEWILS
jgi:hypothetical protein